MAVLVWFVCFAGGGGVCIFYGVEERQQLRSAWKFVVGVADRGRIVVYMEGAVFDVERAAGAQADRV
jgi:hypothetical protein